MTGQTIEDLIPLPAWGHSANILHLGPAIRPASALAAIDRMLICERIARYCWAYDERRLELLADCFTEDAIWDGNVIGQIPVGPWVGRDTIKAWLSDFWVHQKDQRRHMLLNTIVEEQTNDTAVTLSYLLLMSSTGEAMSMEAMGFYRTEYQQQAGHWRISRLTAGFDKPFWPGDIKKMSARGRSRHGVAEDA